MLDLTTAHALVAELVLPLHTGVLGDIFVPILADRLCTAGGLTTAGTTTTVGLDAESKNPPIPRGLLVGELTPKSSVAKSSARFFYMFKFL